MTDRPGLGDDLADRLERPSSRSCVVGEERIAVFEADAGDHDCRWSPWLPGKEGLLRGVRVARQALPLLAEGVGVRRVEVEPSRR